MRRTIHLRFTTEVADEGEAWDVAERLEKAAIRQDYTAISAWVEDPEGGRAGVLGPENDPPTSEAMRVERVRGLQPTGVGDAEGVLSPSQFGQEEL